MVDEQSTRGRTQYRADEQRDAEPAHELTAVPLVDEAQRDRHADRLEEPTAETLYRTEHDEALDVPGQPGECRAHDEEGEREM